MTLELLPSERKYPVLVFQNNKFYKNKLHNDKIYWYCAINTIVNTEHRCNCIIHTNIQMTKVLSYNGIHNHLPTYTKNKMERIKCIETISSYNSKVKDAFTTFSIDHPKLSITHFDKLSEIVSTLYRKRNVKDGFSIPKTFDGIAFQNRFLLTYFYHCVIFRCVTTIIQYR